METAITPSTNIALTEAPQLKKSVTSIIKQWSANSLTEFSEARSAPPAIYTDPDIFELEMSELFLKEWILIARAGQIPKHGDYFTYEILDKSIIFIRQEDGTIKALANACLHHFTSLVQGSGCKQKLVCPYHSWTYQADGQLIGIPQKDGFQRCNKSGLPSDRDRLLEYRCEIWHGFIFLSLNESIEPISERLANLEGVIEKYSFDKFEDLYLTTTEFECNWKTLIENFVESYHVPYLHKSTFGPLVPPGLMKMMPGDNHFTFHVTPLGSDEEKNILNKDVPADDPNLLGDYGVFPNGLIGHHFDYLWWINVRPIDVDRSEMRWGISFHPNALASASDAQTWMQELIDLITAVLREDKLAVEGVQRGARLMADDRGCFFHAMEQGAFEFQRYVASKLEKYVR